MVIFVVEYLLAAPKLRLWAENQLASQELVDGLLGFFESLRQGLYLASLAALRAVSDLDAVHFLDLDVLDVGLLKLQ